MFFPFTKYYVIDRNQNYNQWQHVATLTKRTMVIVEWVGIGSYYVQNSGAVMFRSTNINHGNDISVAQFPRSYSAISPAGTVYLQSFGLVRAKFHCFELPDAP